MAIREVRALPLTITVRAFHSSPDCRVGGGAPVRWPPSAAQSARAVFPHAAFTKTSSSETQSKLSDLQGSQARTRRTAWFPAAVASHRSSTPESVRTYAPHDPAAKSVEEQPDMGPTKVEFPSPQNWIDSLDHIRGLQRYSPSVPQPCLISELADRFLAGASRFPGRAGYTRRLCCAGAPRRPTSGSRLSLPALF